MALLLTGIGCAGVMAFFQPTYQARFRLRVHPYERKNLEIEPSIPDPEAFFALQQAMLLGNTVLEKSLAAPAIASHPNITTAKDPINTLRRNLHVGHPSNTFIDVTFRDHDPKAAADVVNSVVDEYLRQRRVRENVALSNLERQAVVSLNKAEAEVDAAKTRVRDLSMQTIKNENNVAETPSGRIDSAHLDDLRKKRTAIQSQLKVMKAYLEDGRLVGPSAYDSTLGNGIAGTDDSSISEKEFEADERVAAAQRQLNAAKQRWTDLQTKTGTDGDHPDAVQAKQSVDRLASQLEDVREWRKKALLERRQVARVYANPKMLESLENSIAELSIQKDAIEGEIASFMVGLRQPYASSVDLQFAESDLKEWLGVRDRIHDARIRLQMEREAPEVVLEFERAVPVLDPVDAIPYRQLAIASVFGMSLPFLFWLYLSLRRGRARSYS